MDITKRKLAAQRVSKFAFVGLVEEWELSLCLFHRVLGGKPLAVESEVVRVGSPSAQADECPLELKARLGQDEDPVDSLVYKAAKEKFEKQVADALASIREQASLLAHKEEKTGSISRHLDV